MRPRGSLAELLPFSSGMKAVVVAELIEKVHADRSTLTTWDLGEEGKGYAVQLRGPLDRSWFRSFCLVHLGSPRYSRFQLDPDNGIVWFACRTNDRAATIVPVLDILDRLIEATNERHHPVSESDRAGREP